MSEQNLDLFWGRTSQNLATVFAQWRDAPHHACELQGSLYGPVCRYSRTLPVRTMFESWRADGGPAARALIPDPCFWSPTMPFQYRVDVKLMRGSESIEHVERMFGIRMFGISQRDLRWEGKRWVARGCELTRTNTAMMDSFHDPSVAMCVSHPSDEICRAASEVGVLVIAGLSGNQVELRREIIRLARWPAVAMVAISATAEIDETFRPLAPNLVLAARGTARELDESPPWASALILQIDEVADAAPFALRGVPVLVSRRMFADVEHEITAEQIRAACDQLQSELASIGDFAGYLVRS